MSKAVSFVSGIAVLVLLMVLGGTIFGLAVSESQADPAPSSSVGTAFTYQGHLTDSQGPANGSFDLTFSLYDDLEAGSQVGTTISRTVTITGGLLSLDLDFGSVFDGTALWLEISLRPAGDEGPYTPLEPRQRLAPTPLATFASSAPWTGLTGVPAGFADSVDDDTLAILPCALGQIPESDGTGWTCGEDDVSTGNGGGDINGVIAGIGLTGGGLTGTVTLNVELSGPGSADTVARSDHDHDGTYSPTGHDHGDLYYTQAELATSGASTVHWGNITGVPGGLDDGDDDTTYSAGNQITLTGTTFDLVEGAGSGLDADLLDGQDGAYYRAWGNITGIPGGLDDGDDDLLATLDCTPGQLARWNDLDSQWECSDDLDTDTTYQAGTGLTLSDTTFAISSTYLLPYPCALDQVAKWNGSAWACASDQGGEGAGWSLTGNSGTVPGTNFLGTTDQVALELHANARRALLLEPGSSSPNLVGGYGGNSVADGTDGAAIGGGGRDLAINQANGNYSTVDGGAGNTAGGYASAVGGGEGNSAGNNYSTASGGASNSAGGPYTVVGGGQSNAAMGTNSTVSGGGFNQANTAFATVGGGYGNVVSDTYATVSGGAENEATGAYASLGGGSYNRVAAAYGTIAGGGPSQIGNPTTTNNRVFDDYGTVGGGGKNVAGSDDGDSTAQGYATISGGFDNAASGEAATVGGGSSNEASGDRSVVGGGSSNVVTATHSTVGGGANNVVTATYGTVPGGRMNKATGNYAIVGGGGFNEVSAGMGTIGGGASNLVTATFGTIPGGSSNYVGGQFGFAAGYQARAEHQGSFIWSDATGTFTTTAPNQFLIDASGGVGIGTNAPSQMLAVQGSGIFLGGDVPVARGYYASTWGLLDGASAVFAVGSEVYVTASSTNTLSIFNVADPNNVEYVGHSTSNLQGPSDLFVSGQRAYVTSELNNRLVVFDVSNPANPDSLGSTDESLTNPVAVDVEGKYAFVASNGTEVIQGGLAIFDVSDPRHIRLIDLVKTNLVRPNDIYMVGSLAYVTDDTYDRLAIFDVSDPRPGKIQARGYVGGAFSAPRAVHVSGPYAYVVAENSKNLVILDVSDPDNIVVRGSTSDNLYSPTDVFVAGQYAYVTSQVDGRLALFDVSDPDHIVALGFVYTPHGPKSLFVSGKHAYVANQVDNSLSVFEVNHLQAPTLQTGNLQTTHLDVVDNAVVNNDLAVHGGLQVGGSGALIDGALSVTGLGDSHILGALSVGGAGALISDTVYMTRTQWMTAPTHALDVIGEGRFRVNDYHNLVLRSANAGGDEDAYIDLVRSNQTTVMSPTARIQFDVADPLTHSTSLRFYTQGSDDSQSLSRLEITSLGDVRPGADAKYLLGIPGRRWHTIYSANGVQATSDGRLKENVVGLPYGLDAVRRLRPVAFTWQDGLDDRQHYGLIAQEVAPVLPDLVMAGDDPERTLSMNYAEVVPVLVKAIQEQQEQLDTQADQIAALEARLVALEDGRTDRAGQTGTLKFLSAFGMGGLVLGALVVAGTRRNSG